MLRSIDLNLLRVFESVMRYRSATAAAAELGVTPSAVSHALARLRTMLQDELFIVGASGLEPTAYAIEIAPDIQSSIDQLIAAVQPKEFMPSKISRTFNIGTSDYLAEVVVAPLIARLAESAPLVNFRIFPVGRLDIVRCLDEGRVDFFISWFKDIPGRFSRSEMFTEEEALVVRNNHPLTRGELSIERLLEYPHVVVEVTGTEENSPAGFIDERSVVRRNWMERLLIDASDNNETRLGRVAVTVPYFASVPPILKNTDMVATLPRSYAISIAEQCSLSILTLPYEPLKVPIEAMWHKRSERDPSLNWIIGETTDILRKAIVDSH